MADMNDFYDDPFSVPIPMRAPVVVPIVKAPARDAAYYDQAAKNAVIKSQKDMNDALLKEGDTLNIKSWLTSENPFNTADGSLNPFAQKVGDTGMSLTNKLILGAVVFGAIYIYLSKRRR